MSNAEYLKRYAAPKSWHIDRKKSAYIAKPNPGPQLLRTGMPLGVVLASLGHVSSSREAKKAVVHQEILVDKRRVRDARFPVGFMDTIEIPSAKEAYAGALDANGRLVFRKVPTGKASVKVCKLIGKTVLKKGIVQLNLSGARSIVVDKAPYRVGDSIVISVPDQKILSHLPLAEGSKILLTGGRHIGELGKVREVAGDVVTYAAGDDVRRTSKGTVFVVPEDYNAG